MVNRSYSKMRFRGGVASARVSKKQSFSIFATEPNIINGQLDRVSICRHPTTARPLTAKIPKMTMSAFSTPQERWSAIVSRNPNAVGAFVYAVKTTGIYCRPDCKARLARQANVVLFTTGPLAAEAGYRACKRCKPDLLESLEEDPLFCKIRHAVCLVEENASRGQKISLQELSQQVGLSKWHLLR